MPFKSESQRRKFYHLLDEGKISQKVIDEWEANTPSNLPERIVKKAAEQAAKLPYRVKSEVVIKGPGDTVVSTKEKGYHEFPGGGLDPKESPKAAVIREAMEETGIALKNIKKVSVSEHAFPDSWKGLGSWKKKYKGFKIHHFTAEPKSVQKPTSREGDAWKEVPFVKAKEVLRNIKASKDSELAKSNAARAAAVKALVKSAAESKRDPRLERAGVSGYNKVKRTPNHPTKSHIVVAKEGDKVKTIRFGQQGVSGSPKKRRRVF